MKNSQNNDIITSGCGLYPQITTGRNDSAMEKEKIQRINELAKKSKTDGLSDEEKAEQASLRAEYLAAIRRNFKAQLDSIEYIDNSGRILN